MSKPNQPGEPNQPIILGNDTENSLDATTYKEERAAEKNSEHSRFSSETGDTENRHKNTYDADAINTWKLYVNAIQEKWNILTEDELAGIRGSTDRLTDLVKNRYSISHDEATKQVNSFFDNNKQSRAFH